MTYERSYIIYIRAIVDETIGRDELHSELCRHVREIHNETDAYSVKLVDNSRTFTRKDYSVGR